jgi:hypothetical protein
MSFKTALLPHFAHPYAVGTRLPLAVVVRRLGAFLLARRFARWHWARTLDLYVDMALT